MSLSRLHCFVLTGVLLCLTMKSISVPLNRVVAVLFAGLLLALFTSSLAAHAAVTDVTVYDDADVLDDAAVASAIEALSSEQDVHIAVLASDDHSLTENSYDEDVKNLIESGDYADIAGDGSQTLKDDVVLIAISPEVRKLGTYTGDGVRNGEQVADKSVGDMKPPAQDGDWSKAAVTGADASLQAVNGEPQVEWIDRLKKTIAPALPLLALLGLGFAGVKTLPVIFKAIKDHRHTKRLLAWSPSRSEISASVRYWGAIEQRLGEIASNGPAQESLARQVFNQNLLHSTQGLGSALPILKREGYVPDEAKTAPKTRELIESGFTGSPDAFWSKNVEPLLRRVKQGTKDQELRQEIAKAEDARDDARRFIKAYGDEIELSEQARDAAEESQTRLKKALDQVNRDVKEQQTTPWEASKVVDRERQTFESDLKGTLRRPLQNGMTRGRRRDIADQSPFHSNSFLISMLIYTAISSSYQSAYSSPSSSYSGIGTSISTPGFSGGSGSF